MFQRLAAPTDDIAFKKLFADPNNSDLLIDFLNAALEPQWNVHIKEVTVTDPVHPPKHSDGKTIILDVYCKDQLDNNFIVEMQVASTGWSLERAAYYMGRTFVDQVKRAGQYQVAKPVYLVAILCFNLFPEHSRYVSYHQMLAQEDHEQYLKSFNCVFVELPKFKKHTVASLKGNFEPWCMFLKDFEKTALIKELSTQSNTIKKAMETIDTFNWTEKEQRQYEAMVKIQMDNDSAALFAKMNAEAAIKKAQEEALEKGLEKGLEQGLERGKSEGLKEKAQSIAKKMLSLGIEKTLIVEATGLTVKEIENL